MDEKSENIYLTDKKPREASRRWAILLYNIYIYIYIYIMSHFDLFYCIDGESIINQLNHLPFY